ncbi:hypothetical protein AURDEDRAFT_133532 [Auricularia subglabra TFB-10046 SS5]|nr:hypothetical protein AURDEDRAFT_133532 [Auricularia subglabra TFB-10046 SS5]
MQSNSNSRAQLLSGLRTGGVRSTSQPTIVPHTAAIGGSFNVPRFASFSQPQFPDEEDDELADMVQFNMHLNGNHRMQQPPMSASAADGVGNRFQQQQQQQQAFMRQMAAQRSAMNGMGVHGMNGMGGMDPLQMQVMQIELMKLQAIQQAQQAQQFQAELIAQAQRQQQPAQRGPSGRRGSAYNEPATAGPTSLSFDMRGPSNGHLDMYDQDEMQVPMTAALGGKFGSRPVLSALNPNASVFTLRGDGDEPPTPKTAVGNGRTTVISGGTSLGAVSSASPVVATPTKSDSATSWRRGGAPSTGGRSTSGSPAIKLTPPTSGSDAAPSPLKTRPSPLRFGDNPNALPAVGAPYDVESGTESDADSYTSDLAQLAASASEAERDSSPSTPPSAGSGGSLPSREEASKRLYEGLGMGRPVQSYVPPVYAPARQVSQVLRQPRGPPASVDELGPRNFAARLQLKMMAEALAASEL